MTAMRLISLLNTAIDSGATRHPSRTQNGDIGERQVVIEVTANCGVKCVVGI
jgi:hypothetical protein